MENFRKTIQRRIALMSACNVVAIVLVVLASVGVFPFAGSDDFIHGFLVGVVVALELLRKEYVKENDERNKAIRSNMGGAGRFLPLLFLAATVVAGFFDRTVFFTLLACTWAMALYLLAVKIYYRNKL